MDDSDDMVMDNAGGLWRSGSRGAAVPRSAGQRTAAPETTTAGDDVLPETGKYEAFKAVDGNLFTLSIYTNGPADVAPAYQYYQYVASDPQGKIFDIVYGFFVVRARGRNLAPVIRAIKNRKCAFIQQYQQRKGWSEPGQGDPFIEKIEIVHEREARSAMLKKG